MTLRPTPPAILLALGLALAAGPAPAGNAEDQRQRFRDAYAAMEAGQVERAWTLGASLEDYPLAPYLAYRALSDGIRQATDERVSAFLAGEADTFIGESLRNAWVVELARRGDWEGVVEHYRPGESRAVRCLYLEGRSRAGVDAALVEEALQEWLSGETPFEACGKAFAAIGRSSLLDDAQRWQRIENAVAAGRLEAARDTGRGLPEGERPWVDALLAARQNPLATLERPELAEDGPAQRRVIAQALVRLAREDAAEAARRWDGLQARHAFEPARAGAVAAAIAVGAVSQRLEGVLPLLDAVPPQGVDEAVQRAMVRAAVEREDWQRLARWTELPAASESERPRWQYWRARALELTGRGDEAQHLYRALSTERDYYGFRAADRIGAPYALREAGGPDAASRARLETETTFVRAAEWRALGRATEARREWAFGARGLEGEPLVAAAAIAHDWGWHDRVISTLGRAGIYDAVALRFPTPHRELVEHYAGERGLAPATVFSIMRAESAFQEDARSAAGALGLMQVMPATGALTARRLGLPQPSNDALLEARTNIALGTAYLSEMLDRFHGNLAMAAAAYNAGPGRVLNWQPAAQCVPTEFWVETIPFRETYGYVRKILFYDALYDWRLGGQRRVSHPSLAWVPARDDTPLGCANPALGMKDDDRP